VKGEDSCGRKVNANAPTQQARCTHRPLPLPMGPPLRAVTGRAPQHPARPVRLDPFCLTIAPAPVPACSACDIDGSARDTRGAIAYSEAVQPKRALSPLRCPPGTRSGGR